MGSSREVNVLTASNYQDPSFDLGRLSYRLLKCFREVAVCACSVCGGFFSPPQASAFGCCERLDPRQASLTQYTNSDTLSRTHRTEALKDINLRYCKLLISGLFLQASKF